MKNLDYYIAYLLMVLSYSYLGITGPDLKSKLIGILLTIANGLIFWR